MANRITRHIPNTITSMNLFSGCIAIVMAFQHNYKAAFLFIILGAVFDFFDGMSARLLHAHSIIGKDIDSLADDISFGFAPATIVYAMLTELTIGSACPFVENYLPYMAFIIAVFSALRLAKFNNDTRQSTSFIGLPTPANALFWASLVVGGHSFILANASIALYVLIALVLLFSWLLVAEIPMFSLKLKNLSWRDNRVTYLFIIVCVPMLICLGWFSFAAIILWYIILSLISWTFCKQNKD